MNSKSQAWYMDFAIGLLLFTFTLVVYFSYTNNFQRQEKDNLDVLLNDAKAVSTSLALPGYPLDWNNDTVLRIGISNDQEINATKVKQFKQYNYTMSKAKFGTQYDYVVFFTNDKGEVLNINSVCAVGYPLVNASYNIKAAYYYQDPSDSFLKDFMNNTLNADIYFKNENNDIYKLEGLMSNISKYSLIVFEHPLLSGGDYNEYYRELNNYTASGGFFLISGELATSQGRDINGVEFWKKTGQSEPQRAAIVNNSDPFLSLNVKDEITFNQYFYATNSTSLPIEEDPDDDDYNPFPAAEFKLIASFNKTPEDYAIATWHYGNGTAYFFSDFDVTEFSGNFLQVVEGLATSFIEGTCNPINASVINKKKLVKTERYLNYKSKIAKMVVYLWQ